MSGEGREETKTSEKVAFLFPGQGSQRVGMGQGFYKGHPLARDLYEQANQELCYDIASLSFHGPENDLRLTVNTQPALLIHSYIGFRLLEEVGLTPCLVMGHSLGEYSALLAAGAMGFSDALQIVRKRGQLMNEAVEPDKGAMAAIIGLDKEQVETLCEGVRGDDVLEPANYNAPTQTVVSGDREAVERLVTAAKKAGARRAILLPVSAPFHCARMRGAEEQLAQELDGVSFQKLRCPVVDNVTATVNTDADVAKERLKRQVTSPVRWEEGVRTAAAEGCQTFVEVGPGKVLSGLARRIVPEVHVHNVEDLPTLEETAAALTH